MIPVILLLLTLAADPDTVTPETIPDPVPLGTTTLEVHMDKFGAPITTRYDIVYIPKAEYVKKHGPLTPADARNFARTGFVLHITTVYVGTY